MSPGFWITAAEIADLDQLVEIEKLSFAFPWSRQMLLEEFEREFSVIEVMHTENNSGGDIIVAFINYWVILEEVHVLNVAVHPGWRRRGLAKQLMEHLIQKSRAQQAQIITLEVRRSNDAAIALYSSLGFHTIGIRKQYYENREDALVMLFHIKPEAN